MKKIKLGMGLMMVFLFVISFSGEVEARDTNLLGRVRTRVNPVNSCASDYYYHGNNCGSNNCEGGSGYNITWTQGAVTRNMPNNQCYGGNPRYTFEYDSPKPQASSGGQSITIRVQMTDPTVKLKGYWVETTKSDETTCNFGGVGRVYGTFATPGPDQTVTVTIHDDGVNCTWNHIWFFNDDYPPGPTATPTPTPLPTPTPRITADIDVSNYDYYPGQLIKLANETKNGYTIPVYQVTQSIEDYAGISLTTAGYSNGVNTNLNLKFLRSSVAPPATPPSIATGECWIGASPSCLTPETLIGPTISANNTKSFGAYFYPKTVGDYYIVVNATSTSNASVLCSGNPFPSSYPYLGFQNCTGPNNEVSRIRINVIAAPPLPIIKICKNGCTPSQYECAKPNFDCSNPGEVIGGMTPTPGGAGAASAGDDVNVNCSYCGSTPFPPMPTVPPTPTNVPPTPRHTPTPSVTPTPVPVTKTWNLQVDVDCGAGNTVYVPVQAELTSDSNSGTAGGSITTINPSPRIAQCDGGSYSTVRVVSKNPSDSYIFNIKAESVRLNGVPGAISVGSISKLYLDLIPSVNQSYAFPTPGIFIAGKSFMWTRGSTNDFLATGVNTGTKKFVFSVPSAARAKICGPQITPEPAVTCTPASIPTIVATTVTPIPTITPKPTVTPIPTATRAPNNTPTPTPQPKLNLISVCTVPNIDHSNDSRLIQFELNDAIGTPNLLLLIQDAYGEKHDLLIKGTPNLPQKKVIYTKDLNSVTDGCAYPIAIISARTTGNSPAVWTRPAGFNIYGEVQTPLATMPYGGAVGHCGVQMTYEETCPNGGFACLPPYCPYK